MWDEESEEVGEELQRREKVKSDRAKRQQTKEDEGESMLDSKNDKWKALHMNLAASSSILRIACSYIIVNKNN